MAEAWDERAGGLLESADEQELLDFLLTSVGVAARTAATRGDLVGFARQVVAILVSRGTPRLVGSAQGKAVQEEVAARLLAHEASARRLALLADRLAGLDRIGPAGEGGG